MEFVSAPLELPIRLRRRLAWIALVLLAAGPAFSGCNRAGGAPEPVPGANTSAELGDVEPADDSPDEDTTPLPPLVRELEHLRAQGRFEEFIDRTLNTADDEPNNALLQTVMAEALLASGRNDDAELAAARAAQHSGHEPTTLCRALKLWTIARLRQHRPLADSEMDAAFGQLPHDDPTAAMLTFWRETLGTRIGFRLDPTQTGACSVPVAEAAPGSVPWALNAVQAQANDQSLAQVFIDTGAQYTLITTAAARSAKVRLGSQSTQLVGFARVDATPGVIERLQLGDLTLYDVPVLVGDSAPLVALGGQMALGTELMQHVRFHLDYPARRVTVEPGDRAGSFVPDAAMWSIPVWTFSQVCLARGEVASGAMARVLVDTGDRAGTFVSRRWLRTHHPEFRQPIPAVVMRFKKRNLQLESLVLGSETLATWPVVDTIPRDLDRLNQVDILVGHDLLWPYQLTIDLRGRVFELRGGNRPPVSELDRADTAPITSSE